MEKTIYSLPVSLHPLAGKLKTLLESTINNYGALKIRPETSYAVEIAVSRYTSLEENLPD
jgi:hypothetical protein